MSSMTRKIWIVAIALSILALLASPVAVYPATIMQILCFGLFAASFDLLFGFVGLLSFGHAAFFGGAAYVTAYTLKHFGTTPEIAILLGVFASLLLGLIVGYLSIRTSGIYFAMVTLAFAQMFYFACAQLPWTRGEDGIQGVPRGRLFGLLDLNSDLVMLYVVIAIFLVAMAGIVVYVRSPVGNILRAIQDNETRAISLGYNVQRYKLGAFAASAALAGLAGSTKSVVLQFATLADVDWHTSGDVVLMCILGGAGTIIGPVLGAGFVLAMREYLATSGLSVTMVTGLVFILCVVAFPQGLLGRFRSPLQAVGAAAGKRPERRAPPRQESPAAARMKTGSSIIDEERVLSKREVQDAR